MRKEFIVLGLIVLIVGVAAYFGSSYYRTSVQKESVVSNGNNNSGGKPKASIETLIRPDSPTLGPADAKVTVVEFLDPECEACAGFSPVVKKILSENEGKMRLVVRYMPFHPSSMKAAHLLEAAGEEGKFWQALELIFRKQSEWGEVHGAPPGAAKPDVDKVFEGFAKELGMNVEKYIAAARENKYTAKVERDRKDGQTLGVRKTPTFFVNGRELARFSEADLRALIAEEMAK
ncbi:MAG TPA: thioredoxin domain-containing protein [Pyrinomonadaceae bacterium]|nr:thioredoxin domain-containing protein [Pyrinomonadaceae bacterium]